MTIVSKNGSLGKRSRIKKIAQKCLENVYQSATQGSKLWQSFSITCSGIIYFRFPIPVQKYTGNFGPKFLRNFRNGPVFFYRESENESGTHCLSLKLRRLSTFASRCSRFNKFFSFNLLLQLALLVILPRRVVLQGALEDWHVQVQLLLLGVKLDHRQRRMPATVRRPGITPHVEKGVIYILHLQQLLNLKLIF